MQHFKITCYNSDCHRAAQSNNSRSPYLRVAGKHLNFNKPYDLLLSKPAHSDTYT